MGSAYPEAAGIRDIGTSTMKYIPTIYSGKMLVKFYTNDAGDDRFEAWGYITGIGPNVEVGALIEETITIRGDDRFDYLIV